MSVPAPPRGGSASSQAARWWPRSTHAQQLTHAARSLPMQHAVQVMQHVAYKTKPQDTAGKWKQDFPPPLPKRPPPHARTFPPPHPPQPTPARHSPFHPHPRYGKHKHNPAEEFGRSNRGAHRWKAWPAGKHGRPRCAMLQRL